MRVEHNRENVSMYDRGGSIEELRLPCLADTGLPAPTLQWEVDPMDPMSDWTM